MRRGSFLLECMLAIGLMGFLVLAVAGLFLGGQGSQVHTLEGSRGSQVAEEEMAHLKGLPFDTLCNWIATPAPPKQVTVDGMDLRIENQVQRVNSNPSSPDYNLLNLRVQVAWSGNRNLEVDEKRVALARTESLARLDCVVGPAARF